MTELERLIIEAARVYVDRFNEATDPADPALLSAEVDLIEAVNNERAAGQEPI